MITPFIDLKSQYAALRDQINARMQAVLDHGQFIMGPEVAELEKKLAEFTGAKHCITCASGTEALLMALMALDIKPGDEVITPSFTFIATAEVVVLLGATPVLVDVEPDTCNLDVRQLEAALTPKTRAIMPVSLYGQTADMDEINTIAAKHGVPVIEDAAQSFGATYKGRQSCNLSTIGCTSFFPSKPLGCYGDGGALFVNDDALALALRQIRVHGQEKRYHHTRIGLGGRMDTLQCAVVLAKLERFAWEIERRRAIGRRYEKLLCELAPMIRTLPVKPDRTSVHAQYTVLAEKRNELQKRLEACGVPTAVHYPAPIHQQPAYTQFGAGAKLAISERAAREVISLPMHADLDETTQDKIVAAIKQSLAA
ncbi:MAG: DegT/DnrJ/EryC1/StrS family aminotransferase [Burkholderiales bacterium]